MIEKVICYIEKYDMIAEHDHVIAGVSGGADSVCLFLILEELREKIGFTMSVVHVEHGIRGEESLSDARFVQELASAYGMECGIISCKVPMLAKKQGFSLEEAARKARYEAFSRYAGEAEKQYGLKSSQVKVAVAHHMGDQAETVLFHLCRGSGVDGLSGIRPVRGRIIRPFLCVTRGEILGYLEQKGQDFCVDETNSSRDYSRNFIRHEILPKMEEVNRQSVFHMAKAAEELAEVASYLKEQTETVFKEAVRQEESGEVVCDISKLNEYSDVIKSRVLKRALEQGAGSGKDITREHVMALMKLARGGVGRKASLPYRLEAERTYTGIKISREIAVRKEEARVFGMLQEEEALEGPGVKIGVPGGKIYCKIWKNLKKDLEIPKKKYTKWLDYDMIKGGLLFRTRKTGDYFTIDNKGHRKNLKDYFINEKVPKDFRDQVVLAADGSHIVWAVGYRISEAYKVTKDTRRILEIRWMEEKDGRDDSQTAIGEGSRLADKPDCRGHQWGLQG